MRLYFCLLTTFCLYCMSSCKTTPINVGYIQFNDTFRLPGIPGKRTFHFDRNRVFYASMDEPGSETFKCFSLKNHTLLWSKDISQIGINEGAITVTGEYVVPTLSDTVQLIDSSGNSRILQLEYRCKIKPLVYKDNFIVQDRGIGLKSFDAKTLKQLWVIKQQSDFTMSQPLLLGNSLLYVLDDKSIQSSNALTGALNWSIPTTDKYALYDLYGTSAGFLFILATDQKKEKQILAVNINYGKILWEAKVDSTVNDLERNMIGARKELFCRGSHSIFSYSLQDGKSIRRYDYKSRIVTNMVFDKDSDILFGLDNNNLMMIRGNGDDIQIAKLKNKIDELYMVDSSIYLYSYPDLYRF